MTNTNTVTSEWMETNLPWKPEFWNELEEMTVMRLNPHWHIDGTDGGYQVDDILSDVQFTTQASLMAESAQFSITFSGAGVDILARRGTDGQTELAYHFDADTAPKFDAKKIEEAMLFWLPSLREYYRLFATDSLRNRFWRFFMNKVMLKMNPTQRRICAFMFKLTLLEMILIVVLAVGFWFYSNAG